jgi:alpha-aminoadipic semialdehyde synthase
MSLLRAVCRRWSSSQASEIAPGGLKGNGVVGVRRETKNRWERRAPLAPQHVRTLTRKGVTVLVQPSRMRIFTDGEYERAGAVLTEDLSPASLIVGVKEIPIDAIIPERTYVLLCPSH